jgi:hypothetical protein
MTANIGSMAPRMAQNQPQANQPLQRGQSLASQNRPPPPGVPPPQAGPPQQTQRRGSKDQAEINSIPGIGNPFSHQNAVGPKPQTGPPPQPQPEPQQNATQAQSRPPLFRKGSQTSNEETKGDEVDDTMRNLRKTFAGIFGDM